MIQATRTAGPAAGAAPTAEEARLRKACNDMEGVFLAQLFAQMRESVPQEGIVDGGTGEEVFSGMMDEHIAAEAASGRQETGIGAALFRQLRAAFLGGSDAAPAAGSPAGGAR
jgi:flagellar protein FlgJ